MQLLNIALPKGRLELFYCGSAPEKRVAGAFARAFAALPRQGALEPVQTIRRPARETCRVVTEELDVGQGKLCIGCRTDCTDMAAAMLMNAMFGGATTSKLFVNVRERLSLCYYADSAYHRLKGLVTVSSGIEFQNYGRAVEEILRQLEALRRGDWEDWEIEGARQSLVNSLRTMEDSAGSMEDFVMGQAAAGSDETIPGLIAALAEVTPERVRAAAEKLAALAVLVLALNAVCLACGAASILAVGETAAWGDLLRYHAALLGMQLEIGGVCFGLSALLRRSSFGLAMGLAAVMYFLGLVINLDQGMAWLRFVTPYYYADAARIYAGEALAGPLAAGCLLGAAGAAWGLWRYGRKDIAA